MAEYISGPTLIMSWAYSAGTISMAADERSVQWSPSGDLVDASAGADTYKVRLAALKDASASVTLVNPTSATGGTADAAAFAPNVSGTLTIQPEGTATSMRKITFPAFSGGAQVTWPYADISTFTCTFTGNGAYTDGVN